MNDKIYWVITVFEKFDDRWGIRNSRTWGFFSDKEKALETLKHNYTDLWETVYDYAVLEPYYEGVSGYCFDKPREWFMYNKTMDGYLPLNLNKEPEEVRHYVSFAFG